MTEDEQIVREAWERVEFYGSSGYGCHVIVGPEGKPFYGNPVCNAWAAARAYTDEHAEEIRRREREISCIDGAIKEWREFVEQGLSDGYEGGIQDAVSEHLAPLGRILTRLHAELSELKKGWKL
jgi:hypothetical protein